MHCESFKYFEIAISHCGPVRTWVVRYAGDQLEAVVVVKAVGNVGGWSVRCLSVRVGTWTLFDWSSIVDVF